MKAGILVNSSCVLGEGPWWHANKKSICWVDIENRKILEFILSGNVLNTWVLDEKVSMVIEIENDNRLLVALENGIATFDMATGTTRFLKRFENPSKGSRSNDGACDANGRLWLGSMDKECRPAGGSLHFFNEHLTEFKKISPTDIANGLAWSHDNKLFYFIDSTKYCVNAYHFDLFTGNIVFFKTVIRIPQRLGMPDGMAIDEEGKLWIAHWGGYAVIRWNPETGEMMKSIEVPVPNVTSCCFGGDDLDILFITTAKQAMGEGDLQQYPHSGGLFMVRPGVKGKAKNKFSLPANYL